MRAYIIVAATLWIVCTDAAGQAYRWVDDQGRVHYTQTPPPPGAKRVERKYFRQGGVALSPDMPYATQVAAKNYPVTLYTISDCGSPCDQARASLVKRAVPFREMSVSTQEEADQVKKLSGKSEYPLLVVGSLLQSGFLESLYNNLLDTAGYPASGPRLPIETLRKLDPPPTAQAQSKEGGSAQPQAGAK